MGCIKNVPLKHKEQGQHPASSLSNRPKPFFEVALCFLRSSLLVVASSHCYSKKSREYDSVYR